MNIKKLTVIVLTSVFLLSACGSIKPTEQKLDILKITMSNNLSYGPLLIAEAEGYFKEFGIQMEYVVFEKNSEAIALLISGTTDIYAGTLNIGFLNTLSGEENFKAVADRGHVEPGKCTYQAILVRKDLYDSGAVTKPADLVGQTFSISTYGPASFLLESYLAQDGLTLNDINAIDIPSESEMEGYANKSITGSVAPEPDLTRILNGGNAVILARAEDVLGVFQSGLIAFGKNILVDNPELGARFLAAYLKGVRQFNEGKTERNMQIMIEATGESRELLQAACWPPVRDDGMIDFTGVDPFQQWAVSLDQMEKPVSSEQFFDPSFLAAAQDLLNP
jgi:NitT/TauT family transport system substrate-binding protein